MGISQNASPVVFWWAGFGITSEYHGGTSSIDPCSRRSSKKRIFKAASWLYRYLGFAREEHPANTCATLSATFPHNLHRTSPSVEVCVFSFVLRFVGNNCSYSSYMPAMVYVGHEAQPFNHAKQLVMLRPSPSHLVRNNFPCHFLSLAISKNCFF